MEALGRVEVAHVLLQSVDLREGLFGSDCSLVFRVTLGSTTS